ncbi:MAG: hypothetical protein JJT85_11610 [Chromatiales bacterium]|nr:hypothetical protein [Chromatiales bacterium]
MPEASSRAESAVISVASLQEFFRQSVEDALASNRVAVDTHTSVYVVNLLTRFARSEAFHGDGAPGPRNRPLSLMLNDVVEAGSSAERMLLLRRLGDVALFVSGFMADGLHRHAVGVDYYVRMGGGAYQTLASAAPDSARTRAYAPVFAELAAKFQDLVDALNEVRSAAGPARDADVLRLYELWLTTGSRRAARLLRQLGIAPVSQSGSTREH